MPTIDTALWARRGKPLCRECNSPCLMNGNGVAHSSARLAGRIRGGSVNRALRSSEAPPTQRVSADSLIAVDRRSRLRRIHLVGTRGRRRRNPRNRNGRRYAAPHPCLVRPTRCRIVGRSRCAGKWLVCRCSGSAPSFPINSKTGPRRRRTFWNISCRAGRRARRS